MPGFRGRQESKVGWRILAPLRNPDEVADLVAAGAGELYAGLLTKRTLERTGNVFSFNHRPHSNANLGSLDELRAVMDRAAGVPLLLVYNLRYHEQASRWVLDELSEAVEAGISGVILADLGLAAEVRARHPGLAIHASSVAGIFNSEAAALWRDHGACRAILPRALGRPDIEALAAQAEGIDLELFIMTEKCPFANAHCGLEHGLFQSSRPAPVRLAELAGRIGGRAANRGMLAEDVAAMHPAARRLYYRAIQDLGSACSLRFDSEVGPFSFAEPWENKEACGLCSLWWIRDLPAVKALKVVGRTQAFRRKLGDVRAVREAADAADCSASQEEFQRHCRAVFRRHRGGRCDPDLCYYEGSGGDAS